MPSNRAPGLFRDRFGFETWPDFNPNLWQTLCQAARASQREQLSRSIQGSDRDANVLKQARINARNCGLEHQVQFRQVELAQVEAPADQGVLLCNPPYGDRLGQAQDLGAFYTLLGNVLKQRFKGWTAYILSGNKALAQAIGLKSSQRIPLYNGSLACQLMRYELY